MSGIMSYFGRRDTKQSAREAIIKLRQQLVMLEKKEHLLEREVDQELKTAKANAVSNKALATTALKRKRAKETQLEQLRGQQMQLQTQTDVLESTLINIETVAAMKRSSEAMQGLIGGASASNVDATMAQIAEQQEAAKDISDMISKPLGDLDGLDDEDILDELGMLEDEVLSERLAGAEHVPLVMPEGVAHRRKAPAVSMAEDDDEIAIRQMQAEMGM
ncbi:vacuolar sorting protein [Favolaschia claudopus]|uniref:Vacuolar-sorting protein SNF7 n=1 Tax=Favolaschia claudopus TaxID=2862362 RepID=A0AAW0DTV4_9AGAR